MSAQRPDPRGELGALLRQQREHGERLLDVSRAIGDALRDCDYPALHRQLDAQRQLHAALDDAGRQLSALLEACGQASDSAGLRSLLRQLDGSDHGELHRSWRSLREILGNCRERNHGNRVVALQGERHSQEALALLSGASRRNATTYDASGAVQRGLGSRDLGAA